MTISVHDAVFVLNAGNITVDSAATFAGSGVSSFTGGYLQFAITGANRGETLGLVSASTANTTFNAVTIVANKVFLGTGSSAVVLGSVDSALNGLNGNALRINLSIEFPNGNFENGTNGSTIITDWTTGLVSSVQLDGIFKIAGQATPIDTTYGSGNTTGDFTSGGTFVPTIALSDYDGSSSDLAVRLDTGGASINEPFGTIRGPYVYSDSSVTLAAGDSISFAWKALSGGDAYDAYGYLLDVNTGSTITILDDTATTFGQETPWATVSRTIAQGEQGTYRFVFVSGSFDLTGGQFLGAALMIDDVEVTQANPARVEDAVMEALLRSVTYTNTANELFGQTRTLTTTAVDGLQAPTTLSDTASITIVKAYSGPVPGLVYELGATPFNDILAGTSKSDFIYALESDDAVDGRAGDDVIDGGPGSNFLVGGAGVDNFFLDGRAPTATTWSTIMDFQAGEHVTIWGTRPGVSKFLWVESDGTAGYRGATLHGDLDGNGVIDTSVTFAGLTQAQLPTPSYGIVQGTDYILI